MAESDDIYAQAPAAPTPAPTPSGGGGPPIMQRNLFGYFDWAQHHGLDAAMNVLGAPQRLVGGTIARGPLGGVRAIFHPEEREQITQEIEKRFGIPHNLATDIATETLTDPTMLIPGVGAIRKLGTLGRIAPWIAKGAERSGPLARQAVEHAMQTNARVNQMLNEGGLTRISQWYTQPMFAVNPYFHGGNVTSLNYLWHGIPTALKGLGYGVRPGSIPKATLEALQAGGGIHAFPTGQTHGALRLAEYLPGGKRAVEGLRNWSNRTLGELELGQRASAFEKMAAERGALTPDARAALEAQERAASDRLAKLAAPKPAKPAGPNLGFASQMSPKDIPVWLRGQSANATDAEKAAAKAIEDKIAKKAAAGTKKNVKAIAAARQQLNATRAQIESDEQLRQGLVNEINARLGNYHGPLSDIAKRVPGPFARWHLETVPKAVGSALRRNPERVVEPLRVSQDVNEGPLKNSKFKLFPGGVLGDIPALMDPREYLFSPSVVGPLGAMLVSSLRGFAGRLGDSKTGSGTTEPGLLKQAVSDFVPGASLFDIAYPSNAPPLFRALSQLNVLRTKNRPSTYTEQYDRYKAMGFDDAQTKRMMRYSQPRF